MKVAFQLDKHINISFMPENENETNTIKELIRYMGSVPRQVRMVPPVYLDPVVHFVIYEEQTQNVKSQKSPGKK